MALPLRIKFRDWDFWTPLLLGDVKSDKLDIRATRVASLIDNVADDPESDAAEMSFSRYNLRVDQAKAQGIVAVPFFIMRGFRTRNIVTTIDSPLEKIEDLAGKRIGLSGWQDSGNTWTRALLRRVGVDCDAISWVLSRCTDKDAVEPNRGKAFWNGTNVVHEPQETPLVQLLHEGKIDAMFQAFMPRGYCTGALGLRPVVRDFKSDEIAYFHAVGYVPGIHILAFKEAYVRANPWAVRELCRTLDASSKLWREKRRRYAETTPWILQDLMDEGQKLTPDYDAWDLESNRKMIDDFCREAYEQHLTKNLNTADSLFPDVFS